MLTKFERSDVYTDQPLFANTDMARRWHELGFIVQERVDASEPIFVERQRNLGARGAKASLPSKNSGHRTTGENHGIGIALPAPDSEEEPITSIGSLQNHLRIAMGVELSTIPLYLASMYSINTEAHKNNPLYYDLIIAAIRGM
jgi:hypothetical protein